MPTHLAKTCTPPETPDQVKGFLEWPLTDRPGFLIRRMHQIHVAQFTEHCGTFGITPVQNSVLWAVARRGKADQTTIAADVALDRTTTVDVLKRLATRHLVARTQSRTDRRAQLCVITPQGTILLAKIEAFARAAHRDTIAVLSAREQETLLSLMKRVVLAAGTPG
jgi:MarR family transcriptional regulator, lower aerobic nicotinate degradation pathway regulator